MFTSEFLHADPFHTPAWKYEVIVECCCFLIIIIVGSPEPWLAFVLCNCRHFQVSNVTTHTQNHEASSVLVCCCDLVASSQSATVSSIWLRFCTLNSKTHMFCSIALFSTFFFIMIFFQKHSKLQQIYTFGASRADEMLTCAQTSLFSMVQGHFFQGGRSGEA